MKTLSTFEDVLSLWESPKALSDALGVPYINAQAMKARKSIAVDHWPKLIEALKSQGYSLSNDELVAMAIKRREGVREGQAA